MMLIVVKQSNFSHSDQLLSIFQILIIIGKHLKMRLEDQLA